MAQRKLLGSVDSVESLRAGLVRGDAANAVAAILDFEALCRRRRVCMFRSDQASTTTAGTPRRVEMRLRSSARIDRAHRWTGIIHVDAMKHWIAADVSIAHRRITLYDSLEWPTEDDDDLLSLCPEVRLSKDLMGLRGVSEAIGVYEQQLYRLVLFLELYLDCCASGDRSYVPVRGHAAPKSLRRPWKVEYRCHAEVQGEGECGIFSLLLVQKLQGLTDGRRGWSSDITREEAREARIQWYETIVYANGGLAVLEQIYANFTPMLVLREVLLQHLLCGAAHQDGEGAMAVYLHDNRAREDLQHLMHMHALEDRLSMMCADAGAAFLVVCLTEDEAVYKRFLSDVLPRVIEFNTDPRLPVTVVCGMRFPRMTEATAIRVFPAIRDSGVEHLCQPWYIQVLSTYRKTAASDTGPAVETRLARTGGLSVPEFREHPKPDLIYSNAEEHFRLDLKYMSIGFLYGCVFAEAAAFPRPRP